jgi:predicted ABC-type ATPase
VSRLDLVVGPNGAGKSTFVRFTLASQRPGVPFVNADILAAQRWQDPAEAMRRATEASELARAVREQLLADRREFIAETVASHPSKVDLVAQAARAGYYVAVHVMLVPEDLAVQRVARRVESDGHDVPEDKIRARYRRLWAHVAAMVPLADAVEFYDNSGDRPRSVASFIAGELVGTAHWPDWAPEALCALAG